MPQGITTNKIAFSLAFAVLLLSLTATANAVTQQYYFNSTGWYFYGTNGYFTFWWYSHWYIGAHVCISDSTAKGKCTQVYRYNANAGNWSTWDVNTTEKQNGINRIEFGGYWINASAAGYTKSLDDPGFWEAPATQVIFSAGSAKSIYDDLSVYGWNVIVWANQTPMKISEAVILINKNFSKEITRVFCYNSSAKEMISECWPNNPNEKFDGDNAFWVCIKNPNKSTWCAENDPPLMPWQNKRPSLANPAVNMYLSGGSPPDEMGQGNGQNQGSGQSNGQGSGKYGSDQNTQTQGQGMTGSQSECYGKNENGTCPKPANKTKPTLYADFYVTFTDPEGDYDMVMLYIDGKQYPQYMATGNARNGMLYDFNVELSSLGSGTHNYWFVFNDGKHSDARYPILSNLTFKVPKDLAKPKGRGDDSGQSEDSAQSADSTQPAGSAPSTGIAAFKPMIRGFFFTGTVVETGLKTESSAPAYSPAAPPTQPVVQASTEITTPGMQRFADLAMQIRAKQAAPAEAPSVKAVPEAPKAAIAEAKVMEAPAISGIWTVRKK